jgi:hypothetical protein
VQYASTESVHLGDDAETVEKKLGAADGSDSEACGKLKEHDACWTYGIREGAWNRFAVAFRDGKVTDLSWDRKDEKPTGIDPAFRKPLRLSLSALAGVWVDVVSSGVSRADYRNSVRLGGVGLEFSPCHDHGLCATYGSHEAFAGSNEYSWQEFQRVRVDEERGGRALVLRSGGVEVGTCQAFNTKLAAIGSAEIRNPVSTVMLLCRGEMTVTRLVPLKAAMTFMSRYRR